MLFDEVDSNNFVIFAAKNYINKQCENVDEFYEDLNEFKYIKKLVNRFLKHDDKDDLDKIFRLLLNHVIIIFNVFERKAAIAMMLYKLETEHMSVLKPIIAFLGQLKNNELVEIPLNKKSIEKCRKI